jgi:class 3 adenylate cyclase/tetratricopeptide (TPR) repeat protein
MATHSSQQLAAYVPRILLSWPEDLRHQTVDGTLVHIDISGFTAMSERLAAKGKVGAEEVAGVLTTVFTELLTVAADLGADMLKFGGDALLLLFTGPEHSLRAVRASGEMRLRLRSVGKISTPAGRVSLRMTVGVHAGSLNLVIAGDSHRELIVAGDAATTVVEMEESAEAGEIVLSEATAASLPEHYLGARRGAGRLLAHIPPSMDFDPEPVASHPDPAIFIPVALREAAASGTGEGEHRIITAAFVKYHGTARVLRENGESELCEQLNELVRVTQEAAEEYGVAFLSTDIDRDGGKIILTAGSPVATGADEERMLRTVRAIVDRYRGLTLKVGVNRGPAFSGDVGAPFRRAHTVIGDAVNLAARVMSRAADAEILATDGVLAHSAVLFDTEPVPPFQVKGKTAPVEAWTIGGVVGRRSTKSADTALVGREGEMKVALGAIDGETVTGLVDVVGPSGIGKSRLVRELRAQRPNVDWHFSAGELFEASTPYFAYQRLLREVLGIDLHEPRKRAAAELQSWVDAATPELAPWLPLIASVMDLPCDGTEETEQLDAKYRRARTHEVVEALIDSALPNPTVMIIEDAHWLDEASRELTSHLAAEGAKRSWLLMPVHRPTDFTMAGDGDIAVELGPLSTDESHQLAEILLEDSPMLASRLAPIVARAGGNPLFLTELVNAADSEGEAGELPDSIEALVLARIDRLDPIHRKLLRYASVVGTSFDIGLLTSALEDVEPSVCDPQAWKALEEYVVGRTQGDMRFRQQLFHDVAYSGLPYKTRRILHERVGLALERLAGADANNAAERLSVHFMRAELFDKAWHYSLIAGNEAKAKFGNADAIEFYARAIGAAHHLDLPNDEVAEVAETLGDVAEVAGMYDEADKAFSDARRLTADDPIAATRLLRKQGVLRERRGAYSQALRWYRRALNNLNGVAECKEEVEVRLAYAGVRFRQARYDDQLRWANEALDQATRQCPYSAAHALRLLGLAERQLGDGEQSLEYLRQALRIYEENGDLVGQADCLNNLGGVDYRQGKWDLASARWEQCTETRRKVGDVVGAAMAENNIAAIRSDQGKWDEADELFHQVRRVLRAAEFSLGVSAVTSNLGRVAARAGRFEDAHELLAEALTDLEAIGAEHFVHEAKAHLAEAHLFAGDVAACERVAAPLLATLEQRQGTGELQALLHRLIGYARLMKDDASDAWKCFQESLAQAEAADAHYEMALTLEAISGLPPMTGTDAEEAMKRAQVIFERLGVVTTPKVPLPALAS